MNNNVTLDKKFNSMIVLPCQLQQPLIMCLVADEPCCFSQETAYFISTTGKSTKRFNIIHVWAKAEGIIPGI